MARPAIRTLAFAIAISLVIFGASCSGGGSGGGGGTPPPTSTLIRANITGVNTSFLSSFGLIGLTYTVTGPPSAVYNTDHSYAVGASPTFASASDVPQGLANQVNTGNPSAGVAQTQTMNLVLPSAASGNGTGEVTSSPNTFWWYAYADLGFFSTTVEFQVLPSSTGLTGIPSIAGGIGSGISYPGAPSQASSSSSGAGGANGAGDPAATGAPAGSSGGRAGHTATSVRGGSAPNSSGLNVLVAGGYTGASSPNAFDTMDRFGFDSNSFSHSVAFSGSMISGPLQRAHHASAFFIDPSNGAIKVLATGGADDGDLGNATVEHATGNVYGFSPTEAVSSVSNSMVGGARVDHSACWVPSNQVVILGGCSNGLALNTIEHYDPVTNSFFQPANLVAGGSASLGAAMERCDHETVLLADGRVFVAGGYNPSNITPMPCLIYDPSSGDTATADGGATQLVLRDHTATRMANGWVLIVGGRNTITGNLVSTARVYKPETDSFSDEISVDEARAMHTATLLGDKNVLVTGGMVNTAGGGTSFTTSAQVFTVDGSTAGFTAVTIFDALNEARGEHSATATDSGAVFVIGGRNDVGGGMNFLDSIEFFAFSNDVPTVASAMTAVSTKVSQVTPGGATMNINVDVTDAEQDGGYVIIRYRALPSGLWNSATIICQSPSTSSVTDYPNMMVTPGSFAFTWDYAADGVATGTDVEIEIIPVGAVIGSPLRLVGKAQ